MPGSHVKRDFKRFLHNFQGRINKKYKEKGIISWGGAVKLNANGDIVEIYSFGPKNTLLNSFLNSPDVIEGLKKASKETFDNPEIYDQTEDFSKVHNYLDGELEKPVKPIMALNNLEMQVYFPLLIKSVYDKEGLEIINKWAKVDKKTGKITPPTPPCPHWNSGILHPKHFFGMGKGYKFGNTLWRMKLQSVNLLLKYGENPDTYAKTIPYNYVAQNLLLEDLEALAIMAGNPHWIKANSLMEEFKVDGTHQEMDESETLQEMEYGDLSKPQFKKRKIYQERNGSNKSLISISDHNSVEFDRYFVGTDKRRTSLDSFIIDAKPKLDDRIINTKANLNEYDDFNTSAKPGLKDSNIDTRLSLENFPTDERTTNKELSLVDYNTNASFDDNTTNRRSNLDDCNCSVNTKPSLDCSTNTRHSIQIKTEHDFQKQNKTKSNETRQKTTKSIPNKDLQKNKLGNLKESREEVTKKTTKTDDSNDKINGNHRHQEKSDSSSYDIIKFFTDISLPELIDLFVSEAVSMEMLCEMSGDDLKELGVSKFGYRFKILNSIKKMFL